MMRVEGAACLLVGDESLVYEDEGGGVITIPKIFLNSNVPQFTGWKKKILLTKPFQDLALFKNVLHLISIFLCFRLSRFPSHAESTSIRLTIKV